MGPIARERVGRKPPREPSLPSPAAGRGSPECAHLRDLAPTHAIVNVDENRKEDVEAIESFAPHVIVTHPEER